ncbi:MAG: TolC family protein [Opitutae bacterium]|nr:TolC family protein [Opitutae bacterium]
MLWRAADLARDDLRTDLDLVLSGDLGSDSMKSGQFKSDESSWSVGLELDTPLAKIRERNRYKEALIRYQQSRRSYLAFEDTLLRAFREHLRLSNLYELNFELNRAAVRGAIAQVDLARLRLDEPPQPGRSAQFGATTARDLVNALNDLLDASNNFLDVWIGYEAMRMRYAFDLGQLRLNENGIWEEL